VNLGTQDRPRRVNSAIVTPELLSVIGVSPLRGRYFTDADSYPGAEKVAIIAYNTWQNDYGGDETLVGRAVPINAAQTRIIGVMPAGFDIHDERLEVYLPLPIDAKT